MRVRKRTVSVVNAGANERCPTIQEGTGAKVAIQFAKLDKG
jgi:hypothetical protein